jgi:hypothetical protein
LSVLSHDERTIEQPGVRGHWLPRGTGQKEDFGQMGGGLMGPVVGSACRKLGSDRLSSGARGEG